MAIGTITVVAKHEKGPLKLDEITVAGPSSYTAGGDAFKAAFQTAIGDARTPIAVVDGDLNGGYRSIYKNATDKLMWLQTDQADDPEEDNTTANLSGITFRLYVWSV